MYYVVVDAAWDIIPFESEKEAREHLRMLRAFGNRSAYLLKGM